MPNNNGLNLLTGNESNNNMTGINFTIESLAEETEKLISDIASAIDTPVNESESVSEVAETEQL